MQDIDDDSGVVSSQAARLILDYWFEEYGAGDRWERRLARWFRGGDSVDQEIGARFGHRVELALAGGLKDWEGEPESRLALILVLDQFTRHVFRGTARAFAGDRRAVVLARKGLARGLFESLPLAYQVFAWLPLEHSELLSDQAACVSGMEALLAQSDDHERPIFESFLEHARAHKALIERFGRFPHRNASLGRISTENERRHLQSANTFGQGVRP